MILKVSIFLATIRTAIMLQGMTAMGATGKDMISMATTKMDMTEKGIWKKISIIDKGNHVNY